MSKEHGDKHHLIPGSRIREARGILPVRILNIIKKTELSWKNKRKKSIKKHHAWHFLFNNRLPCEAINMVKTGEVKRHYNMKEKKLSQERIDKLTIMEKQWQELFGNVSSDKAIKIIKKCWTPRDFKKKYLCFQFKECSQFYNPKKTCPLLGLRIDKKKGKLIKINLRRRKVSSPFKFFQIRYNKDIWNSS